LVRGGEKKLNGDSVDVLNSGGSRCRIGGGGEGAHGARGGAGPGSRSGGRRRPAVAVAPLMMQHTRRAQNSGARALLVAGSVRTVFFLIYSNIFKHNQI
jgi:hypothetical protein